MRIYFSYTHVTRDDMLIEIKINTNLKFMNIFLGRGSLCLFVFFRLLFQMRCVLGIYNRWFPIVQQHYQWIKQNTPSERANHNTAPNILIGLEYVFSCMEMNFSKLFRLLLNILSPVSASHLSSIRWTEFLSISLALAFAFAVARLLALERSMRSLCVFLIVLFCWFFWATLSPHWNTVGNHDLLACVSKHRLFVTKMNKIFI